MLYKYTTKDIEFKFVRLNKEMRRSKNFFTIIVGKNGTGKSRLLREISLDLLRDKLEWKKFLDATIKEKAMRPGKAHYTNLPTKLICVSTSPFDKFPLIKRSETVPYYSYLGLRGLTTSNMGLSYISRIIYTLAEAANRSESHSHAIGSVLEYLNYDPVINVTFSPTFQSFLPSLVKSGSPRNIIREHSLRANMFTNEYVTSMRQLLMEDEDILQQFIKSAERLAAWPKRTKIGMQLNLGGVKMRRNSALSPEDIVLLGRYGMLRLRDVELYKKGTDIPVMISEMSSGEQTVIMGLLGIGSQIEDEALVCIDEPEVCLHPEWQERYIQLLSQIFSHYRGCQFIVTTHSPQIVAQLPEDGCYVMQMEDGIAHPANEYSKRSIDFQLARVFKAPGYKNEYLSRLALNIFVEVAKTKEFSKENRINFQTLISSAPDLRFDDPLLEIIKSVQEMYNTYG